MNPGDRLHERIENSVYRLHDKMIQHDTNKTVLPGFMYVLKKC